MKRSLFFTLSLLSASAALHADFLLDQVMPQDVQKQTGVANLSLQQKIALENWLNENFVLKTAAEKTKAIKRFLSINIDNGNKLLLSDNSLWQVSPDDVSISGTWLTPVQIDIKSSNNPDYPCLLINTTSGSSVKARQIPNVGTGAS